jgi:threonine dehydrogenase-like Zn-dependent dehydrogenase
MQGAVLYGPRDVCFEEREVPRITKPTDATLRLSATCICGSDLWPYRGIQPIAEPTPMGHECCGFKSGWCRLRCAGPGHAAASPDRNRITAFFA